MFQKAFKLYTSISTIQQNHHLAAPAMNAVMMTRLQVKCTG
jgi:hypothetical protein